MSSDGHRLRVALDMTLAVVGQTGVERYAVVLHEHLAACDDVEVRSFAAGRGTGGAGIGIRRRYRIPLRVLHLMWRTVHQPSAELLAGGADVVHALGGLPPPTRRPLVVTVHDLLPLTHPQFFIDRVKAESTGLANALHRAAIVVTTCEATAVEIERLTGFPRARIAIAPLAPRETQRRNEPASAAEPYLLAVGVVTPRKGLDVLAEAVARLGPACPPVLVVGPDGWWADDVRARIRALDRYHRVSFLGEVDNDRLDELLAGATVVCHPSLAEGFGMVCLEAMAHGTPVVAADLPSVREVGADGVRLVHPGDPVALADALDDLLSDVDARDALRDRGLVRAASYTWDRFTVEVVAAYRRAVDESS
jgi:glycosyltransferase involved in cell wall biosynthesis